ncbi:MAG TPA: glycoside hydrolase family 16 protein, partial [Polyangiaceae bacterium]|nr:glycoside hydrolase family 16 protein [Polyangiaceae bacterium]
VTSGGMAGVAAGSPNNVSVDNNGYLHLKISNSAGDWTAAEIFSTDKLGFGTYQWQVDAPIDRFDKNVVLGLFPYGPAAGIGADGTNEIDIEYSFWGNANGVNGDWTDYPNSGKTIGEKSYKFSLNGGTFSTSRFIWSSSSIQNFLMSDFQPVGSTTDLINSWTYAPTNPSTNIPQQAMPLGINLWCFDAPPSDGKNVEVVIRDFQFVAEGSSAGGAGGTGGMAAGGASTGGASAGGTGGVSAGGTAAGGAAQAGAAGIQSAAGASASAGAASASGGAGGTNSGAGGGPGAGGSNGSGAATGSAHGGTATLGSAGSSSSAASNGDAPAESGDSGSCSFRQPRQRTRTTWLFALPLLVLGRQLRRRKAARAAR